MRRPLILLAMAAVVCVMISTLLPGFPIANAAGNSNVSGCVPATPGEPREDQVEPSPQQGAAPEIPFDLAFIDAMIGQQSGAIALGNQALQYARDSQVRRIALRIVESQAGEIQLLRTWRDAWYPGADRTKPPSEQGAGAEPATVAPPCSAPDFDRQFLEMMIAQHEATIDLARSAEQQAQHEDLRKFAGSIVEIQSSEVTSMQTLLERLAAPTPAP